MVAAGYKGLVVPSGNGLLSINSKRYPIIVSPASFSAQAERK
jgi:hypothetical protein